MEFICSACGRKHIRTGQWVDEHIHCECGYDFYAFYHQGVVVTLPFNLIRKEAVAKAFRHLVASVNRSGNARTEADICTDFLRKADPLGLIAVGMERYQAEVLGKSLLTCGDFTAICESLLNNKDLMLKNKGNYVDIIEFNRKMKKKEEPRFLEGPIQYLQDEYMLKDWQKEIMEENDARSGYLFGDTG